MSGPEIRFQAQAIDHLDAIPWLVPFRVNCGPLARSGRKNHAISWWFSGERYTKGVSDTLWLVEGVFIIFVELKTQAGKLRKSQELFRAMVENQGGLYFEARSMADIEKILQRLKPLRQQARAVREAMGLGSWPKSDEEIYRMIYLDKVKGE